MDEPLEARRPPVVRIGCDDCVAAGTAACTDCIVTFLHDPPGASVGAEPRAVVLDLDEARALRRLARAGLVPACRHRRTGARR